MYPKSLETVLTTKVFDEFIDVWKLNDLLNFIDENVKY